MPQEPFIEQDDSQETLSHLNEQTEGQESQNSQEGQENTQQNQQQPQWNPQEWALNYRGQQIYPKDRQHLVNLAQKGYSYESAMEQLNQERQRIAQMEGQFSRYSQLDEALKTNPQLAQQLWELVQGQGQQQTQNQELDPQFSRIQSELEELKSWKQQYAEQQASAAIDRELQELAGQYTQFDWNADDGTGSLAWKVMKHAYDNNISSLKTAFRDYMFDQANQQTKFNTLKQQKETQQRQARQGVVTTGAPTGNAQLKPNRYSSSDSYGDLAQKALQALGG